MIKASDPFVKRIQKMSHDDLINLNNANKEKARLSRLMFNSTRSQKHGNEHKKAVAEGRAIAIEFSRREKNKD